MAGAMAGLLSSILLLQLLTIGDSIRIDFDGAKIEEQGPGIEFSLFHRDSENSPIKRSGMSYAQRMSLYLEEDLVHVSQISKRVKRSLLARGNRKLAQTVSVTLDATSKLFTIGAYVLTLNIGTPPQKQNLLLSTSSEFSWVQCTGCSKCYKQLLAPYSPSNSSSFSYRACASDSDCDFGEVFTNCTSRRCVYKQGNYANQVASGSLVLDNIKLNLYGQGKVVSSPKVSFGCTTNTSGYSSYADGVAGFGPGSLSLPNQLAKFLGRSAFSSCLAPYFLDVTSKIVVGPASIPKSGVAYTPLVNTTDGTEYSFYYIKLTGVKVGNTTLSIPSSAWAIRSDGSGGTILDAGTTFTFFVPSAYNAIMAEVKKQTSKTLKVAKSISGYKLCFSVKLPTVQALNNYFPNITLLFSGGATITLQGYHYADKTASKVSCVTFQKSSGQNVLGTLIYQNILVVHDITGGKIGFQPRDCIARPL